MSYLFRAAVIIRASSSQPAETKNTIYTNRIGVPRSAKENKRTKNRNRRLAPAQQPDTVKRMLHHQRENRPEKQRLRGNMRLLLGSVASVSLLIGCSSGGGETSSGTGTETVNNFATETVTNIEQPIDGVFTGDPASDPARGKPAPIITTNQNVWPAEDKYTVMFSIAHWCPHCDDELPNIIDAAQSASDDVEVVLVSSAEDKTADNFPGDEWIRSKGWEGVVIDDTPTSAVLQSFGSNSFPFAMVVGPDGNVISRTVGSLDSATIEMMMQQPELIESKLDTYLLEAN